ncbi:MAG: hypothetical protein ACXVJW_14430 [Acidimicrobiia bacterium]
MTALVRAATVIDEVRAGRLLANDLDTAALLSELSRHLREVDEYLDGIERHDLPATDRSYPAGSTVGYLLMHDPVVRRLRELRGLAVTP